VGWQAGDAVWGWNALDRPGWPSPGVSWLWIGGGLPSCAGTPARLLTSAASSPPGQLHGAARYLAEAPRQRRRGRSPPLRSGRRGPCSSLARSRIWPDKRHTPAQNAPYARACRQPASHSPARNGLWAQIQRFPTALCEGGQKMKNGAQGRRLGILRVSAT
jgi:hypothetical protein